MSGNEHGPLGYGAIYIRKSMMPGADNDLAAHLSRCEAIVIENGLLPRVFQEEEGHRSARSEKNRPAFREFLQFITRPDCRVAVANDRARIWRDHIKYGEFLRWIKSLGKEFIPATEPAIMDVDTAMGMASEGMMGILNAFYPAYVADRMRSYYDALRSAGIYHARRPPLGLKVEGTKHQRHLIVSSETYISPDGTERRYIDTVTALLNLYVHQDLGSRLIARALNERGYRWKSKKNRDIPIRPDDVAHAIELLDVYGTFVDEKLWRRALSIRAKRRGKWRGGGSIKHPPLLLRKVATCSKCNRLLVALTRPQHYQYYFHSMSYQCEWSGKTCSARRIHKQVLEHIGQWVLIPEDDKRKIIENVTKPRPQDSQIVDIKAQREKLATRLHGYEQMKADGDIDRTTFLRYKRELQDAINALPIPQEKEEPELALDESDLALILSAPEVIIGEGMKHDPTHTNLLMRSLFDAVKIDMGSRKVVEFVANERVREWVHA